MDKAHLATELRQRQYTKGLVPRRTIDGLSDDEIIDSYVTCGGCGRKMVTPQALREIILEAASTLEFLDLTENQSHAH